MSGGIIFTGVGVQLFRLNAAKRAIMVEQKTGLKHSKLGSVRVTWAKHLGMKPRSSADAVIAKIDEKIKEITDNNTDLGVETF